uniref:Uncharacterized protein n=1 Tax=Cacopsylla melanoneura TaxID=428564 RepID=A0A8D8LHW6_9HEMI
MDIHLTQIHHRARQYNCFTLLDLILHKFKTMIRIKMRQRMQLSLKMRNEIRNLQRDMRMPKINMIMIVTMIKNKEETLMTRMRNMMMMMRRKKETKTKIMTENKQ